MWRLRQKVLLEGCKGPPDGLRPVLRDFEPGVIPIMVVAGWDRFITSYSSSFLSLLILLLMHVFMFVLKSAALPIVGRMVSYAIRNIMGRLFGRVYDINYFRTYTCLGMCIDGRPITGMTVVMILRGNSSYGNYGVRDLTLESTYPCVPAHQFRDNHLNASISINDLNMINEGPVRPTSTSTLI